MRNADNLYEAGLQIFLALHAILENQSNATVATAIRVIGQWDDLYHNSLVAC